MRKGDNERAAKTEEQPIRQERTKRMCGARSHMKKLFQLCLQNIAYRSIKLRTETWTFDLAMWKSLVALIRVITVE